MASLKEQWVMNLVERLIENKVIDTDIYSNELTDFKKGDIVKCSYLNETLYRVLGNYQDKVTITKINLSDDILQVSPKFLEKQDVNKDAVRVLFDET